MDTDLDPTSPAMESRDETRFTEEEPDRSRPPDTAAMIASAVAWVEQNQTLAMLGAFALGVFIGTMMRD